MVFFSSRQAIRAAVASDSVQCVADVHAVLGEGPLWDPREQALGFTQEELEPCFCDADRLSYEQFLHVIDGKTTGALRASLGLATTFADVYQYVEFARAFVDRSASSAN